MLTEDQIRSLTVEYYQDLLRDDELWRVNSQPVNWKDEVEAREYLLNYFLVETDEELEKVLRTADLGSYEAIEIERRLTEEQSIETAQREFDWGYANSYVDAFLSQRGMDVPKGSVEYRRLGLNLLRARREALRVSQARSEGNWAVESQDPMFRQAIAHVASPPTPTAQPLVDRTEELPIWDLVEKFLAEKLLTKSAKPKAIGEMRTSLRWLIDTFGESKRIRDYTAHDLVAYKDKLLKVPARFTLLLKCRTIDEAIERNKERNLPTLDAQTINGKRLSNVDTFFDWAVKNHHADHNPAAGVLVATPKAAQRRKKRDGFTIQQLNTIFRAPVYTGCKSAGRRHDPGALVIQDFRYWLPLVALYSGGRKTELCQMAVADVQDHDGIICLKISDTGDIDDAIEGEEKHLKNRYSDRLVPVHPELRRLGFLGYIDRRRRAGERKLFDCEPGARNDFDSVTKWFTTFRRRAGIGGKRTVFHSFRHNFEQAMTDTGMNERVQFALGGRTDDHSVTSYAAPKPALLFEAISKVRYEGLDLSHLYPAGTES
jgi:integrase